MRTLAPALVLLLTACGGPLTLEGGAFGPVPFAPVGAIAARGTAGLTVLALEAPASCEEVPPRQPGKRALVLQVFEVDGPGTYAVPDEASGLMTLDPCVLGGQIHRASAGSLEIESDLERVVGRFDLTIEGEAGAGQFDVELCPEGFPVARNECPDESDLPPPPEQPEGA